MTRPLIEFRRSPMVINGDDNRVEVRQRSGTEQVLRFARHSSLKEFVVPHDMWMILPEEIRWEER